MLIGLDAHLTHLRANCICSSEVLVLLVLPPLIEPRFRPIIELPTGFCLRRRGVWDTPLRLDALPGRLSVVPGEAGPLALIWLDALGPQPCPDGISDRPILLLPGSKPLLQLAIVARAGGIGPRDLVWLDALGSQASPNGIRRRKVFVVLCLVPLAHFAHR